MEEIIEKLKEIVLEELDKKTIPSAATLDIVKLIFTYYCSK